MKLMFRTSPATATLARHSLMHHMRTRSLASGMARQGNTDFVNRLSFEAARYAVTIPCPTYIIDCQPDRSFASDPLHHYGALCFYYMYMNPGTAICWNGGYEPGSDWRRHWSPPAAINIGLPTGSVTGQPNVFATGTDTSLDVTTAMTSLSNIGAGNMTITAVNYHTWSFAFTGTLGNATQPLLTANVSLITPTLRTVTHRVLPGNHGLTTGEVQTVMVSQAAGTGTATISFRGQTANWTYNSGSSTSSASAMQTALNGLSTIGGAGGSVTVVCWLESGAPGSFAFQVTFGGALVGIDLGGDLVTAGVSGLTPSQSPSATITRTTTGGPGVNEVQQLVLNYSSATQAMGTMSISWNGQTTAPIAYNAPATASPPLIYNVYSRDFTNALVLYRPLSMNSNGLYGAWLPSTSTSIALGGTYYPVDQFGRIGSSVTSYNLQNGQGVILYKTASEVRPQASSYTLSLPNRKTVVGGATSDRFMVAFPTGYCLSSNVTITPDDGGAGGSFAPPTVVLGPNRVSAAFRYNAPAGSGPWTISATNNRSLTDPLSVTI